MAQDLRTRVPADPDGDRARADEAALRTTQQRLRAQKEAFQAAIDGAPLEVCLGILARLVAEETAGEARTQFYLADPARTCLHPIRGAGDMPEAYLEQVDGFLIGEESLACGLTTATGRPVVTRDVFAEPLWAPWVHLARAYDFRGCWSFPIDTRDGRTVGTFALYFRMAREPAPHERVLVELVTQTAAIIIARHTEAQELAQAEAALREREARLRKLISAQTVGVLFFTLDGRITDANATFERQSGYTTNELRAISHWGVLTPPEFADVTARAADELAERGETAPYEKQMIRKDGSRWWGLFAPLRLAGSGRQSHCAEFIVDSTERKHAEAALRISEERLRVATHAARIATFEIDVATGLVVFDANILAVLYGLESETGDERPHDWRPLVQAWLRPADAKRHTELLLATMRGEGDLHNELLVRNPASGAETWIEAYATLVRDAAGRPSRVVGIMRNITEQKRAEAERERLAAIEAVAAERQALLKRIVRAQEEERARVSREIHDSVTQLAHAAAIHLDNAIELLDGPPAPARAEVERGRDLARAAAAEARRLIAGLRPETLDTLGLSGALQQEVGLLRAAGGRVDFEDGDLAGVRLEPEAEITLFRVAQEALSNVRKHAGHARVRVRLKRHDGSVRLEVRDWGRGFDPQAVRPTARGEHVGLTSMRERLHLLGGKLEIRSGADQGTTVRAILPIGEADSA